MTTAGADGHCPSGAEPAARTAEPAGYDAVLLVGFGGPDGPEDVMPFLRTVTRGRGVPDERLAEVAQHYLAVGGASPINAQNRALRAALAAELGHRGVELPVLWGNRNGAPYLTEVVSQAAGAGATRLLAVTTSAYSSYSSCRQYREDLGRALLEGGLVGRVRLDKVRPYFDHPGFLGPFADGLRTAIAAAIAAGITAEQLQILFTTHSIPDAMADTSGSGVLGEHGDGGAYRRQHLTACAAVMTMVEPDTWDGARGRDQGVTGPGLPAWQLVYQSRSGAPATPWLEPDINDAITTVAAAGRRGVVVVPIGFVSDHMEVVWDLDNESARTAAAAGLWFHRVQTPGTDPRFVAALADLVAERLRPSPAPPSLGGLPRRPDACPPGCCVNPRELRPTTAGADSASDWSGLGFDSALLAASGIGISVQA